MQNQKSKLMQKAEFFVRNGDVELCGDSSTHYLHFRILTKSNIYADVYFSLNIKTRLMEWSCNHTNKSGFGCVMYCGDRSKPFCSHCIAAELHLEKWKNEFKDGI